MQLCCLSLQPVAEERLHCCPGNGKSAALVPAWHLALALAGTQALPAAPLGRWGHWGTVGQPVGTEGDAGCANPGSPTYPQ